MTRNPQEMSDDELLKLLEDENRKAVGYLSDEVAVETDDNLDRYLGHPYGDEEEGSSNAMSFDVAEVVDWAMGDLLEPFISGDKVAEFRPNTRQDQDYAEQATEFCDYVFHSDNDGVTILHDVVKTALIQKIGIAKITWEDEQRVEKQTLTGLATGHLEDFRQEDGVEILEAVPETVNPAMMDETVAAAFADGKSWTVTLEKTFDEGLCKIETVPPEEFKVAQRARSLDATYLCHETSKTRGDLIEMGFDEAKVMEATSADTLEEYRDDTRFWDQDRNDNESGKGLTGEVLLREEYLKLGPRTVQAFRVGKVLLSSEEVPWHPFETWSPDRIPNRLIGQALADKVKQTQRVKTVLTRQLLDNVYLANNPRIEVPDQAVGDDTYDDLLSYRIGGLIRTKGQGQMLRPFEVPDRSSTALQAIQYMDMVREQQSGVVKGGAAAGSEMVDPKSAQESHRRERQEQTRKRLMVRMLAETFVAPVYDKILKTIVRHQDFTREIEIRGDFQEMDPRPWSADMRARVSVGLGHTNRDELLQGAQIVMETQMAGREMGLVHPEHFYASFKKMIEGVGWRFADEYAVDPTSEEGQARLQQMAEQEPQQDPRLMEVQAKSQARMAELQMESQFKQLQSQRDFDIEMLKAQAKREIEVGNMEFNAQAKMAELNQKFAEAEQKMMMEFSLKQRQQDMEFTLKRESNHLQGQVAHAKANGAMSNGVRFGGDVG